MDALSIFAWIIYSIISAFELLMLVRAICSWVSYFRESFIYRIAYTITEPVLAPVRELFMRWEFMRRCPIDLSFLAVFLLIQILGSFFIRFM